MSEEAALFFGLLAFLDGFHPARATSARCGDRIRLHVTEAIQEMVQLFRRAASNSESYADCADARVWWRVVRRQAGLLHPAAVSMNNSMPDAPFNNCPHPVH